MFFFVVSGSRVTQQFPSRPEWRLTANGRKWIEENVLVKLWEKEVMP